MNEQNLVIKKVTAYIIFHKILAEKQLVNNIFVKVTAIIRTTTMDFSVRIVNSIGLEKHDNSTLGSIILGIAVLVSLVIQTALVVSVYKDIELAKKEIAETIQTST